MESVAHQMTCMEIWGGNQPADGAVVLAGLDVWVHSRPYRQADGGGDIHYVSSCATGRICRLLVADVAGHGSDADAAARMLRGLMRKFVNFIDQRRFVGEMNRRFTALSESGAFATAIVATFFSPTRHLSVCNAGHPPPLLYRVRSDQWSVLAPADAPADRSAGNIPLGIMEVTDYQQFDLSLEVGDLVIFYTDSLLESRAADGTMLGAEGLCRIANEMRRTEPAAFLPEFLEKIRGLYPGNVEHDDVTVLMFRPNGTAESFGWREKLKAPWRFLAELAGPNPTVALPDFRLANIGGAILPALSRRWGRKPGGKS
jgi:serine phosphatase RsbU (regulator of sigma subunit)